MATKGPSNRYGETRGGRQMHDTGSISYPWAKGFNRASLGRHYDDHAVGIKTKESYVASAVKFANTVDKKNCVSFVDSETGSTYKYNKATNEFAIITKSGYIVTYYKPKGGYNYYKSQKTKHGKKGGK